jgi:glycosyltransferase involved in cell wall biosynthesis
VHLSVIIPTRNRVALLQRTLESLSAVHYPPRDFEVIVVDTASTDGTKDYCGGPVAGLFRNFRYERCEKPGLHVGRHRGARVAAADLLVYADDDIRPTETWLAAVSDAFSDPQVALVGGNDLPDFESEPPEWVAGLWSEVPGEGRVLGYYSLVDFGDRARDIPPEYVYGCNFSIRRQVLKDACGFHPDGMPAALLRYRGDGETAVSQGISRLGLRTRFTPAASIFHWVPQKRMSLEYLEQRGFAQGISDSFAALRSESGDGQRRPGVRSWRNAVRECVSAGKRIARSCLHGEPQITPRSAYARGHQAGRRYHQQECAADPSLRAWVLRPDYWDEDSGPCAPDR